MKTHAYLAMAFVAVFHSNCLAAGKDAPAKPVIRPGQPFDVRLTVSGTKDRVRVRVRNLTPEIVSVVGGDDQYVVSSGGEKNIVTMQVIGVSPGASSFKMDVDHAEPDAVFRRELRRVAEETRKRAAALEPTGDAYRLDDVVNVLQQVDVELRSVLFENSWAAFRDALHDYVASLIRRAEEESESDDSRASLVSYPPATSTRVIRKERAQSILSAIIDLLFGTAEKGSTRDICVLTKPPGLHITLTPRSYPPDAQTTQGPKPLTIRVGAYRVAVNNVPKNTNLDFLLNRWVTIECDSGGCSFTDGAATPCPP